MSNPFRDPSVIVTQSDYRRAVLDRLPQNPSPEQVADAVQSVGREHAIGENARAVCLQHLTDHRSPYRVA